LEQLTALEIAKGIRAPGLFAVENFARGGIHVREVAVNADAPAAGKALREIALPANVRVGLVSSLHATHIPQADDVINCGDHVTLIGEEAAIEEVRRWFENKVPQTLRVIIAGGGEVGFHLARALQRDRFRVTIMESNRKRCEFLAQKLPHATVLDADTTN